MASSVPTHISYRNEFVEPCTLLHFAPFYPFHHIVLVVPPHLKTCDQYHCSTVDVANRHTYSERRSSWVIRGPCEGPSDSVARPGIANRSCFLGVLSFFRWFFLFMHVSFFYHSRSLSQICIEAFTFLDESYFSKPAERPPVYLPSR